MCVASTRPSPSNYTQPSDRQQPSRQPVAPPTSTLSSSAIKNEPDVTKLADKTPPWLTDKNKKKTDTQTQGSKPQPQAQGLSKTPSHTTPGPFDTLSSNQISYETSVPIRTPKSPSPTQKLSKGHKPPETCSSTSAQSDSYVTQPETQPTLACDDDVEFNAIFGSDLSDDGQTREIKVECDRDSDCEELVSIEVEFQ